MQTGIPSFQSLLNFRFRGNDKGNGEALEKAKNATVLPLWDGKAVERIWRIMRVVSNSSPLINLKQNCKVGLKLPLHLKA